LRAPAVATFAGMDSNASTRHHLRTDVACRRVCFGSVRVAPQTVNEPATRASARGQSSRHATSDRARANPSPSPRLPDREALSAPVPRPPRDVLLTATQHDIVTRLLDGERARAIARARQRSVDTVRQTVRAIYSRFGVRNPEELAAGIAEGLFNVRVGRLNGREHTLRSALAALDRALKTMQLENARTGTNRRRTSVRLHRDEMNAILAACAQTIERD